MICSEAKIMRSRGTLRLFLSTQLKHKVSRLRRPSAADEPLRSR